MSSKNLESLDDYREKTCSFYKSAKFSGVYMGTLKFSITIHFRVSEILL